MEDRVEFAPSNSRESPDADALYCEECLRVDRSFNDIPNEAASQNEQDSLSLSLKADTADTKSDTTCPSCRDVLDILGKIGPDARGLKLVIGGDRFSKPDMSAIWSARVDTSTEMDYNPCCGMGFDSYLLRRSDYPTRLRKDSPTHTEGKDLPTILIKSWLHACEREHEGCRPNPANELNTSLYLIDVFEECITLNPVLNVRYIALSYVWGNVKSTKLTSGNMKELRKPRSLSSGSDVAIVPQTIRDAMRLTADLDVRYLWVDCLCLIQNDPNLSFYLNRMHLIYASAFLTILVANKDNANGGITGYDTRSTGRVLPGNVINYPNYVLGIYQKATYRAASALPWCSRAWTLQEGLSSRRVLVIDDRICLKCVKGSFDEGSSFGFKININMSSITQDFLPTLCQASLADREPDWHAYSRVVASFAVRKLSYDQDSMKAFLGVINYYTSLDNFQCAVSTRLLYGHPICKLSHSLLWGSSATVLERRMLLRPDGSFVIPSWAWMAWRHNWQYWGSGPLGGHWPSGRSEARELQLPIVIYAQCGICLQNHQMTIEKCSKKASPELVEPEHLDPYLYIKAQRAQFGVSCYAKEDDGAIRSLLLLGTTNNAERIIVGNIAVDHWPLQLPLGDAGALDFIGIYYYDVDPVDRHGRYQVEALCVIPVNGKPGVFERLGVAKIRKVAWDQAAQFDEIILG